MKKYTKIAYIVLVLIVFLSGFFIYKVSGKNSSNEKSEGKTLAEVKHLESEFQNLFNQLNNISFEKYKISSSEIKKEENKTQLSGTSQNSLPDPHPRSYGSSPSAPSLPENGARW